jgi:hypothetical protein
VAPRPLYDSNDDFVTASRRLIDEKKLGARPPAGQPSGGVN